MLVVQNSRVQNKDPSEKQLVDGKNGQEDLSTFDNHFLLSPSSVCINHPNQGSKFQDIAIIISKVHRKGTISKKQYLLELKRSNWSTFIQRVYAKTWALCDSHYEKLKKWEERHVVWPVGLTERHVPINEMKTNTYIS